MYQSCMSEGCFPGINRSLGCDKVPSHGHWPCESGFPSLMARARGRRGRAARRGAGRRGAADLLELRDDVVAHLEVQRPHRLGDAHELVLRELRNKTHSNNTALRLFAIGVRSGFSPLGTWARAGLLRRRAVRGCGIKPAGATAVLLKPRRCRGVVCARAPSGRARCRAAWPGCAGARRCCRTPPRA